MAHQTWLENIVFSVGNVELDTFRPWIDFILRVANEGADSETRTRLLDALTAATEKRGVKIRSAVRTGPGASLQFQQLVRAKVDREFAHLVGEARDMALSDEVLRAFVESLPHVSMGADERGRACLCVEPTPVDRSEPPTRTQAFTSPSEIARANAEWLSRLAKENETKCLAVIAALGVDTEARRLLRCDHCERFFFARAAHRRAHNFCCDDHRRAYDVAHRDPKRIAAYMREYRKNPMRKKKRSRRRLRSSSR